MPSQSVMTGWGMPAAPPLAPRLAPAPPLPELGISPCPLAPLEPTPGPLGSPSTAEPTRPQPAMKTSNSESDAISPCIEFRNGHLTCTRYPSVPVPSACFSAGLHSRPSSALAHHRWDG